MSTGRISPPLATDFDAGHPPQHAQDIMHAFFTLLFRAIAVSVLLLAQSAVAQVPAQVMEHLQTLAGDARRQASFAKADCRVADKHLKNALKRQDELEAMSGGFAPINPGEEARLIAEQAQQSEDAANTAFINARIATDTIRSACQSALSGSAQSSERVSRVPQIMRNTLTQIQDTQVQIALARHRLARISEQRGFETDNPTTGRALTSALGKSARASVDAITNPLEKSATARAQSEAHLAEVDQLIAQAAQADDQIALIKLTLDDVRASHQQASKCYEEVTSALPQARARIGFSDPLAEAAQTKTNTRQDPDLAAAKSRIDSAAQRVESALLHVGKLQALAQSCATTSQTGAPEQARLATELATLQMPDAAGIKRTPEPGNFGDCDGLYRFWQLKTGCRFDEAIEVLNSQTAGLACLEFSNYINGEREHVSLLAHNENLISRLLIEGEENLVLSDKNGALEKFIAARSFARCQTQQEASNAGIAQALSR